MTDEERVAWCLEQREQALELVRGIDEDGWRFEESRGHGPMRDVTSERREKHVEIAEKMLALAEAWKRRISGRAS